MLNLKEILSENNDCLFDVFDYLQSLKEFEKTAGKDFIKFKQGFGKVVRKNQWMRHKKKIMDATLNIQHYKNIKWNKKNFWSQFRILKKNDLVLKRDNFLDPDFKNFGHPRWMSGASGRPVTILWSPSFFYEVQNFLPLRIAYVADKLNDDLRLRSLLCFSVTGSLEIKSRIWILPKNFNTFNMRSVIKTKDVDWIRKLSLKIEKYKPGILSVSPRMLKYLINQVKIKQNNAYIDSFRKIICLVSEGANLAPEIRREAEELFDKPVYNFYTLTAIGPIASECQYQNGLHVYDNEIIVEVENEDGLIASEGKGKLLITSFKNKAMPLIRFQTNDTGEVVRGMCECGNFGYKILNFLGWDLPSFKLVDKTEFSPTRFRFLGKFFPIVEFRITQEKIDLIRVEVSLEKKVKDKKALLKKIENYFKAELNNLSSIKVCEFKPENVKDFQRYRSFLN